MIHSRRIVLEIILGLFLLGNTGAAFAEDLKPNKKRGQVYFKMVCTVCHMQQAEKTIPPASRTMDQWRAYFAANKHDLTGATRPEVSYYMSLEYRETIKDTNKAARKFLKLSDQQIDADVREFVVNGAKDSDTPASCN